MTRERFEALAEAYGGDIARWPQAERETAALLMTAEPGFTRAVLARSEALDVALDAWRSPSVRHELRERVIAAAPRPPRLGWDIRGWVVRAGLGAGLAAACAAGVVLGVAVSDQVSITSPGAEAVSAALDYDALSAVAGDA